MRERVKFVLKNLLDKKKNYSTVWEIPGYGHFNELFSYIGNWPSWLEDVVLRNQFNPFPPMDAS